MFTYLGLLVQLCCGWGGTMETNIIGMCGECSPCMDHFWVCHSSRWRVLPGSTLLRHQGALQWYCLKRALPFVHFTGLSCSGSWLFCKGTDSVGHVFCAPPWCEQLRRLGAWRVHCPRWVVCLNHLPGPSCSVSQVCCESTLSGVMCVSSGELISGCDPPGQC